MKIGKFLQLFVLLKFNIFIWFKLVSNNELRSAIAHSNQEVIELIQSLEIKDNERLCLESENCAKLWTNRFNSILDILIETQSVLDYNFNINMTEENERLLNKFDPISNSFYEMSKKVSREFLNHSTTWDKNLVRMLRLICRRLIYKQEDVKELSEHQTKLESIYAKAVVCRENNDTCLTLDPDLVNIFKNSRDYDELKWAWEGWHNASGRKMRSTYEKAISIRNKASRENGYKDLSEYWIEDFEDPNFEKNFDNLMEEIMPIYQQLHKYVRRKLDTVYEKKYPKNHNSKLIPAHLLGNMWAQNWDNIFDIVAPYPNEPEINITQILIDNNYTLIQMFKQSEDFFVSMGLYEMTDEFWKNSMIVKPKNISVQCHASAYDFGNKNDFRIKMCTSVDEENFYTIHHEMGHIEYYIAYKELPAVYRDGANAAFHEALGDAIALSVMTPKHFKTINLIKSDKMTHEQSINSLMKKALGKLAFVPFAYIMDKWRWNVFRGKINSSNYNEEWWKMRKQYQGLEAPVERTEFDFDPGAKYHIASSTSYSRYFIGVFVQFQMYKSMCELSNHIGPLHQCDFYNSKTAGSQLKKMLQLGTSEHWSKALHLLSSQNKITAAAFLEYFKPLLEWLKNENSKYPNDDADFRRYIV